MKRVIAVANQKGGVGKTTTAINLGAALALGDKRVLLIDSDPQGNATTGLGLDKSQPMKTTYDALSEGEITESMIADTAIDKLKILPSTVDLYGAEIELVNTVEREYMMKNLISSISDQFDFVIIDSPPSLGMLTINSLTAADSLIIPIQTEFYALEGLSQLFRTIDMVKRNYNRSLYLEGILFTMRDRRTLLADQVMGEVKRFYADKVFKSVIPRNVKLSEAPSFGEPVLLYDIKSKGAEAYINLAHELISNRFHEREEVAV